MSASNPRLSRLFEGFEQRLIAIDGQDMIHAVIGGNGPPLLLLHGHPQTLAIWHKIAHVLARHYTLIATDLRGYGDSCKPANPPPAITRPGARNQTEPPTEHANYSKRRMALDQVTIMRKLGFDRFAVLAHDRGARVAHRLAVDHPEAVTKLIMLDIAPTLAMYEQTSEAFARAYWHWFFLIQAAPLPERLISADPAAYVRDVMGGRSAGLTPFHPDALAEYERCLSQSGAAHALCEDYRAAASIDLAHDRLDIDQGRRIEAPTLILWGKQGIVERCFQPLEEWRKVAINVQGGTLPCGHYIAEEAPEALLDRVLPFLAGESH